jgi:single-strand DNA-binding protein
MEKQQEKGGEDSMKSVNKVILLGNLTRDPELKQAQGKHTVCVFGLATNRTWPTEKPGVKGTQTEFHRIVAFDNLAEACKQYLSKGRKVYLEGRLQSQRYTGKDGQEKTSVSVVLEELVMLDSMTIAGRAAAKHATV